MTHPLYRVNLRKNCDQSLNYIVTLKGSLFDNKFVEEGRKVNFKDFGEATYRVIVVCILVKKIPRRGKYAPPPPPPP